MIPGEVVVDFNFRFSTESTAEGLQQRVAIRAGPPQPRIRPAAWTLGGQPFLTTPGDLVTAVQQPSGRNRHHHRAVHHRWHQRRPFHRQICPQVIELGPPNASIHKIDEHVVVADIEPLKNIYRRTLENLPPGQHACGHAGGHRTA
jgi:succinyl-diaminopimelate desuccinylase